MIYSRSGILGAGCWSSYSAKARCPRLTEKYDSLTLASRLEICDLVRCDVLIADCRPGYFHRHRYLCQPEYTGLRSANKLKICSHVASIRQFEFVEFGLSNTIDMSVLT